MHMIFLQRHKLSWDLSINKGIILSNGPLGAHSDISAVSCKLPGSDSGFSVPLSISVTATARRFNSYSLRLFDFLTLLDLFQGSEPARQRMRSRGKSTVPRQSG